MPRVSEQNRIRIQTLHDSGKTVTQLSHQFRVGRTTIKRWIKRPKNQILDKNRVGRPLKVTERISRQLRKDIQKGSSLRKLAKEYSLSHETIRHHITKGENPLFPYKVQTKPKLSAENKRKRIEFCKKHLQYNIIKWNFVD